jgi:putative colanic acid biosynthesis glycosyltransferase
MISIITVNLNELEGLKKISNSIIEHDNIEWIVIDGGSSDGSKEYIESNKQISKYLIEKDDGIYDGMNKGRNIFTQNYAIFLNSGDELINIDRLLDILKDDKSDLLFFDSKKKYKYIEYYRKAKNIDFVEYGMPAIHQSIVYSKKTLKENAFDMSYTISADYAHIASIYKQNPVTRKINIPISIFKSGGISTLKSNVVYEECQRVQREILEIPEHLIMFFNLRRSLSHFFNKILN